MGDAEPRTKAPFDFWREGKYIDLWSVPHILSGTHFGFVPLIFSIELFPLALVTLVLLVLWEWFERRFLGVLEAFSNGCVDVVLGIAGFAAAYATVFVVEPLVAWAIVGVTAVTNLALNIWGWRASVVRSLAVRENLKQKKERFAEATEVLVEDIKDAQRLRAEWKQRKTERKRKRRGRKKLDTQT